MRRRSAYKKYEELLTDVNVVFAGTTTIHGANSLQGEYTQYYSGISNLFEIIYTNKFVAVCSTGVIMSDNGKDWVAVSPTNRAMNGIAYDGNGTYVAVGNNGYILVSHDDGETWTEKRTAAQISINSVAFGAGRFVTVGNAYGGSQYSDDLGETWIEADPLVNSAESNKIRYDGTKFIQGASGDWYGWSPDGNEWNRVILSTMLPTLAQAGCLDLQIIDGEYLISFGNGTIGTSRDGLTWTNIERPRGQDNSIQTFTKYGGVYIYSAYNLLLFSTDLVNWEDYSGLIPSSSRRQFVAKTIYSTKTIYPVNAEIHPNYIFKWPENNTDIYIRNGINYASYSKNKELVESLGFELLDFPDLCALYTLPKSATNTGIWVGKDSNLQENSSQSLYFPFAGYVAENGLVGSGTVCVLFGEMTASNEAWILSMGYENGEIFSEMAPLQLDYLNTMSVPIVISKKKFISVGGVDWNPYNIVIHPVFANGDTIIYREENNQMYFQYETALDTANSQWWNNKYNFRLPTTQECQSLINSGYTHEEGVGMWFGSDSHLMSNSKSSIMIPYNSLYYPGTPASDWFIEEENVGVIRTSEVQGGDAITLFVGTSEPGTDFVSIVKETRIQVRLVK